MLKIKDIKQPVSKEMELFESKFKNSLKTSVPLLDKIMHYIIKRKGKQMRPLFVFLTAKLFNNVNESTYTAASLIELLHTATLVHDDIIDEANFRRGVFSINALWKNKIAVLVGDFLLSQGLLLTTSENRIDLLNIVTKAVKSMSEGELLQMEKSRKMDITEDVYYKIIEQKTASLVAACCGTGACSVTDNQEIIATMEKVGVYVGMAFQIKDDIFDYGFSKDIGKPTGIDIKERKLTLPLIHVLQKVDKRSKRMIINTIKKDKQDPVKINKIISIVIENGGIQYAENKMHEYKNLALKELDQLPNSPAKESFIGLIHYSINRKK